MDDLTDLDREVLVLERLRFAHAGSKEREIRARFDMTPTRYYQLLNRVISMPAALAADPVLVNRLRRMRERRTFRSRSQAVA